MYESFKILTDEAKKNKDIYFVYVDGACTTLLDEFEKEYPTQVIKIGIQEANAISVASGLALNGKTVYLLMFSAFLTTRAAEQIKLDIAYNNANVKLIAIHGGTIGPKIAGYSHWADNDIASIISYPNIKILI